MRSMLTPQAGEQRQSYSPYLLWLIWIFWLFFLAQPISVILALPPSPQKVVDLCGMALFIGLYLWITWHEAWRLTHATPTRGASLWMEWGPIGAMLLLSVVMTLIAGETALGSLIYVSAALCGRLSAWRAVAAVAGLTLLAILLGAIISAPFSATGQLFFIVPAVGSFVYFFGHAVRTNQELRRARQEIARLAVSEERLRFARDLHDLLGHTLSLITLKSELARRLVAVTPEQAVIEIGDIETAARQALVEVREAVSGYRQPTLHSELSGARELLAAAGIACEQEGEPPLLAPAAEAALSWTVREGVTNVIRHSQARSCVITFAQRNAQVSMEVRDDGPARRPDNVVAGDGAISGVSTRGAGLAGLKERVAALGGGCEAGPATGGGWRLVVSVPVDAAAGSEPNAESDARRLELAEGGQPGAQAQRAEKRITPWFG